MSSSYEIADSTNQHGITAQQFLTGFHNAKVRVEESAGKFGELRRTVERKWDEIISKRASLGQ